MLLLDESTFYRDLGSKSGTFVNGRTIRPSDGEIVLLDGDLITAGGTSFVIEIEAPERMASE